MLVLSHRQGDTVTISVNGVTLRLQILKVGKQIKLGYIAGKEFEISREPREPRQSPSAA